MYSSFMRYLLRNGVEQLKLVWQLLQDRRIPMWKKAILIFPVAYAISPFSVFPWFIPFLGQLDDLGVYFICMRIFEAVVEEDVFMEYKKMMKSGDAK